MELPCLFKLLPAPLIARKKTKLLVLISGMAGSREPNDVIGRYICASFCLSICLIFFFILKGLVVLKFFFVMKYT